MRIAFCRGVQDVCITAFWREKIGVNMADNSNFICANHAIVVLLRYICPIILFNNLIYILSINKLCLVKTAHFKSMWYR